MRTTSIKDRTGRPEAAEERLETALLMLREECGAPPGASGFLAGFRARRDAWIDRGAHTAAWRLLALRLAPAAALAAVVMAAVALEFETSTTDPAAAAVPSDADYPDPFAAGLEEAGVATVLAADDEVAYELVAALYEPAGTR